MRRFVLVSVVLLMLPASSAGAAEPVWLIPPVDGPISARFEAPATTWGPGHRGIDYVVPAGTAVRAAAGGTITFAGNVAGTSAVAIDHGDGLTTTYTHLGVVEVSKGQQVGEGHWIGRAGSPHAGHPPGLHFGVKLDGRYMDPEDFLGPVDASSAIYLAPLVWEPPETLPPVLRTAFLTAHAPEPCVEAIARPALPPSDAIGVFVAGIGSKTAGGTSAALYEGGGYLLGYRDWYPFSYRGSSAPSLHEPYSRTDTFGDIRTAATRLREMLARIRRDHPGRDVDLIAHSQGGIVARSYLQLAAHSWDADLPRVRHLVTLATPHVGAPLAASARDVDATSLGRAALTAAAAWSYRGGPIPDPYSTAVGQLAPGSALLEELGREAVLYGTRVLTLAIPNDVVVPADRARWDRYPHSVVPPKGYNGHDGIVTSAPALAAAHAFLRDAPTPCRTRWDLWGPRIGRAVGVVERALPWVGRALVP